MKFVSGKTLYILFILCLLGVPTSQPAYAQFTLVFFPKNTTINYYVQDDAIIGFANVTDLSHHTNGTSPTVAIVSGAGIFTLDALNSSTVNMSGGSISQLDAEDSSTISMSGGSVGSTDSRGISSGDLIAIDSSTLNFYGHDLVLHNPTPLAYGVQYTLEGLE